jgi:putative ABC transport system ATP-binding protein
VPAIVSIRGLVKWRHWRHGTFELEVPRLDVHAGDQLALVAPSGSGKSTLLDLLAFTLRHDHAERFTFTSGGEEMDLCLAVGRRRDLALLRAGAVGYVLQSGGLIPYLTVAENVALPLRVSGRKGRNRVSALCERLGIAELTSRRPRELSAGERQRVAFARALVHGPSLILADEPTAALDTENADLAMALLLEATREQHAAIVVATHNIAHLGRFGLTPMGFFGSIDGMRKRSTFWREEGT